VPLRPVGEGAAVSELREGGADAEVAAALMARLREVRGRLAQDVLPRPRSERAVDRVRVLARNPPQYAVAERTDDGEGLTVHVPITLDPAFDVRPVCSACSQACVHALDAVDDVLALLADELHPRRDELLGAAAQAPWRRWLGALDEALAELEADTARRRAARLWWSVDLAKEELAPHVEEQAQRGGFLKPKRVRLEEVESLVDLRAEDRAALAAVRLMRAERRVATRDGRVQALFHRTLESLVGHPRVSLGAPGGVPWRVEAAPVRFAVERRDDALDLRVHVGPIELEPKDLLGGAPRARTMLFPAPAERVLRIAHIEAPLAKLLARWASLAVPVPADAQAALMQRLSRAAEHVPVQAADLIREVKVEPRLDLVALLSPLPQGGLQIELRARPLPDGPLFRPGLGPEDVLTSTPERQILRTTRDLWAERGAATDLWAALALVPDADDPDLVVVEPLADALEAVERLRHHPGLECQWPQQPWYPATSVGVERLRLSVRTKRDWLGLYGGVEVSGKRMELAVLVEAARRDRGYVALDDGQFLQLEAALAGRLRELAPYLEPKQGGLRISPAAAELVRALGDDAYRFEAEQAWSELLARMDAAAHLAPEVPAHLQDVLRPYQAEGFVWMSRLAAWGAGAVLADDMGLGKTVQAIAMLSTRAEEGPQLVVAPTSVGFNWARELARFAPQLTVVSYAGPDREVKLQRARPGAVFITSYGVVQRDAATLAPWPWATVVLDEAQAIKNPGSRRAKAARALQADFRVALTGTPIENDVQDLWSVLDAVSPGLLGPREAFVARFGPDAGDAKVTARRLERLARLVQPFLLRRKKRDVAPAAARPHRGAGRRHPLCARADPLPGGPRRRGAGDRRGGPPGPGGGAPLPGPGRPHPPPPAGLPSPPLRRGVSGAPPPSWGACCPGGGPVGGGAAGPDVQPVHPAPGIWCRRPAVGGAPLPPGPGAPRRRSGPGGWSASRPARAAALPHLPEGGGHRAQPHRGGRRHPPGSVVEPGGGGSGQRPRPPPGSGPPGDGDALRGPGATPPLSPPSRVRRSAQVVRSPACRRRACWARVTSASPRSSRRGKPSSSASRARQAARPRPKAAPTRGWRVRPSPPTATKSAASLSRGGKASCTVQSRAPVSARATRESRINTAAASSVTTAEPRGATCRA
jgi:hypothetical protein